MKPTIAEIKARTREKSPYFFERDTMRFFGQTMRSFSVRVSPKGNIYIVAPSYWSDSQYPYRPRLMGYTFRCFTGDDLEDVSGVDTMGAGGKLNIEAYIREN